MTPCNLSVTVLTNALPTHYNTIRTETAMGIQLKYHRTIYYVTFRDD